MSCWCKHTHTNDGDSARARARCSQMFVLVASVCRIRCLIGPHHLKMICIVARQPASGFVEAACTCVCVCA